jgi:hypothetical protein
MKQARRLLFVWGCLSLSAGALWAQRYQPAQVGWFDDVQRAVATAQQQGLPVVLFVRDLFGQGYAEYNDYRVGFIMESLLQQMQRSGARWRWQRYDEDLFTQPEVAQAVAPFVRARLTVGYQRLDDRTQNLLLTTGVLSDVDLAWRSRLLDAPYKQAGSYIDAAGHVVFNYEPATTIDELLARERSALVVLSGTGQVLYRFPPASAQAEPTVGELTKELQKLLAPYRTLAEGRANVVGGRVEAALTNFHSLIDSKEPPPDEVRQAAQRELDALIQRATQVMTEAEKLLTRKDYEGAWGKLSPLEKQGLLKVTEALSAKFQTAKQAVTEAAKALYQQSQEQLAREQYLEATALLTRLSARFAGTDPGTLAQKKLEELNADPAFAEKLRQARRKADADQFASSAQAAEAAQDLLKAYQAYKHLADNFSDTAAGAEAKTKVVSWEADAEFMARLANLQAQSEAQEWLILGNNYLVNHLYPQAIEQYTKVVEKHPDTPAAAEARTKLDQARSLQAAEKKATEGQPAP